LQFQSLLIDIFERTFFETKFAIRMLIVPFQSDS
jgi:hypothetical protein